MAGTADKHKAAAKDRHAEKMSDDKNREANAIY